MATSVEPRPAGWFPDPYGTARWRWWDGRAWTAWTETSEAARTAIPGPQLPAVAGAQAELEHLAYVRRFVTDAFDQRLIDGDAALALETAAESRLDALGQQATASPAARPYVEPAPSLAPLPHPAPLARPTTWWDRTREAIAADLSVHGLAYLGVLLVFAGIFGTLVWGFQSFTPQQRAWVELGVPLVLLGAGFALNRAGAPYVASALTLAGGLLLPLVLIASVLDGAPIPPDPGTEAARYATLVALPLLAGLAYGLIGLKRQSSPLRFLAGPALWLAAAMAALPIAGPVLGGFAVATPHPAQMAVAMAAVPLTLLLARLPALGPLRTPTELSAVVGSAVLVLLGALAAISEDAVGWPLAATLALVAVTAELLSARAADRLVNAVQVGAVAGAVLALAPVLATAPWGLLGLAAGVVLAEWIGWRRPDPATALSALALGGAAALALLAPPDWYAAGAFAALTAWAVLRQQKPAPWLPHSVDACVVGLAPLGALAGLAAETSVAVAATAAGVAALAVAVAVANRSPERLWTAVAGGYAAASMAAALLAPAADGVWWRAGGMAAGAVALGVLQPLPAAARAWPAVTGVLTAAGLLIAETQSSVATASWLAAAGCLVTVVAAALPRRGLLTHAGLAGSAVALAALVLGVSTDAMPETWIPVGALFTAVGAFTLARPTPPGPSDAALPARLRTGLGWAYVVVGAVVLLNGFAAIGPWWTVGALAAGAVLATSGAFLLRWPADLAASAIGAAHGLAASVAAAAIVEPSASESATSAALACGALVVAAAAAQWLLPRERLAITGPWGALGLAGVLITAVWLGSEPSYAIDESVAYAAAGGLALAAAGLALAAARLPGLGLWHAAALLLAAAVPYAWLGAEAGTAVAAGTTLVAAAVAGLAVAFGWSRRPAAQWVGPVLTLAVGLWGVGALLAEGDPDLWALALAIAAVLIAVAGLVGRAPLLVGAAAVPAYAAWVLIVSTHLTDARAPWYSIPAGLALLGVVGAIRWHLRAQGAADRGSEVVLLELVGMLVLVSAPVVNAAEDPASAGLALALGVGLAGWGMVTKVRRRLAFGALTVLVTLVVIIAAPLVGLLRTWTGPLLWALVALAGLAALLVAAFLERGRGAVRSLFDRTSRTFADWE